MDKMNWFREAKYGLFIHWGLYAIPGGEWEGKPSPHGSEWIMRNMRIPLAEYRKLAEQFNPKEFDPYFYVRNAKKWGMKYLVFTAKHHDGFAMYDTKVSEYSVMNTPYGKDIVRQLADACEAEFQRLIVEGFKFGNYAYYENGTYAPIDWIPVAHVENKFLFVSKYIINGISFHSTDKCTDWAVSTFRNWLNNSLFNSTFNQEEKSRVLLAKELTAMISGADDLSFDDKIFVLSTEELKKFNLGVCHKTPYCAKWVRDTNYWTRSFASYDLYPAYHDTNTGYDSFDNAKSSKGIRPAIWVELDIE